MKHIKIRLLLILEAVLAVIYAVVFRSQGKSSAIYALIYPVKKIGEGLRMLSLSGAAGNVIAFILYVMLSALPLVLLAVHIKQKKVGVEDILLVVTSVTAFFVIYWFINPGTMPKASLGMNSIIDASYPVFLLLSMVVAYVIIRIVMVLDGGARKKAAKDHDKSKQNKALKKCDKLNITLKVLNGACILAIVVVVFAIFGTNFVELLKNLGGQTINSLNPERNVRITQAFMILRYLVEQIPLIFMGILAGGIKDMIPEMQTTLIHESVIASMKKLVRICKVSIITIVLSQVALNLIQFWAIGYNTNSNMELDFPLISLLLIAGLMLVSKLVEESAAIKQENEMFI